MGKEHNYETKIVWSGNTGNGTENYKSYERSHKIVIENKIDLQSSSDPAFLGDKTKHNPEDLLVSAISSCHMLWYLHLCSVNGIIVTEYEDNASGKMIESDINGGQFIEVTLKPNVTITKKEKIEKANELHKEANKMCFIANSCNFPIKHIPSCKSE